jgi:2-C-methyl-D-erythritol 4-phosphate cytidylyltransferase
MRETPTHPKIIALVPAAGIGARAAIPGKSSLPKQYQVLAGQPMLRHAVSALLTDTRVAEVRVVVAEHDTSVAQALAGLPRTVWRPYGGDTRAHTVLNGLADAALCPGDWVLVHDAARPGLPREALGRLIDACLAADEGGLLALPVADTMKRQTPPTGEARSVRMRIHETVDRNGLWLAQTPQMFRAGQLASALKEALARELEQGLVITDEASAMEAAGFSPLLVHGSGRNVKVTWPEDFAWVESWL